METLPIGTILGVLAAISIVLRTNNECRYLDVTLAHVFTILLGGLIFPAAIILFLVL